MHPNHADTLPGAGRRRQDKGQGHAVACIQKKGKRERIHERDIQDVQFPVNCRTGIVIPAEWNTGASGREFA